MKGNLPWGETQKARLEEYRGDRQEGGVREGRRPEYKTQRRATSSLLLFGREALDRLTVSVMNTLSKRTRRVKSSFDLLRS